MSAIHFQSDGKILGSGMACDSAVDGITFLTVRYNRNGTPDTSYGKNGISTKPYLGTRSLPLSVVFQPDGRVLAGGAFTKPKDLTHFSIARYTR
ncbi:MAG TPA: hypothetical protein VJX67_03515 [Blastocatellia bacterium]|nr:hypothetical protein [Blastocatellia bacterium]